MTAGPRYIAFEGIDGSGKSTQVRRVAEALVRRNVVAIRLFEPTFGPYGLEARERMAAPGRLEAGEATRLFTADRREHVERRLGPALAFVAEHGGFVVLQDRYYLSAPAYQGEKTEDMMELLRTQQAIAPSPDLAILIDVPVETAMARVAERGRASAFERAADLEAVRARFLELARIEALGVRVVDGDSPEEAVTSRILEFLGDCGGPSRA